MKRKTVITVLAITVPLALLFLMVPNITGQITRDEVLNNIKDGIKAKVAAGEYKCCISPPCDMCYLGHWIWEGGSCYCDDMIAQGKLDKVCPQCKTGIEKGQCKSANEEECDI